MTSASFTINGVLPTGPVLLVPGEVPASLALTDSSGAVDVEWSFVGASEDRAYPTITVTGRGTATFVIPPAPAHGFGLSLLLQCRNGGQIARAVICVGSTTQVASGETTERGARGWAPTLNAGLRDASDTAVNHVVAAAEVTYSASDAGDADINGAGLIRATVASTSSDLVLTNAGAREGRRLTIVAIVSGAHVLTIKNAGGTVLSTVVAAQSPSALEFVYFSDLGWTKVRRINTAYS